MFVYTSGKMPVTFGQPGSMPFGSGATVEALVSTLASPAENQDRHDLLVIESNQ
jgi:hypothetical protein